MPNRPPIFQLYPKINPTQTYDAQRGTAYQRGYGGKRWAQLRRACQLRDKICVICEANGRIRPGKHADHIIPKSQGGADDIDNLQWICASCHSRKTAMESRFGR